MKKITLRTKITVTIAGFVALAGVLYAIPTSFAPVNPVFDPSGGNGPIGVAAAGTDLLMTEYSTQNIDTISCDGNVSLLATIPPGPLASCERYIAIAPAQSVNAGFTPRDIFVTQGTEVYKIHGSTVTSFATIPGCADDHTGITFDHVSTFGYN